MHDLSKRVNQGAGNHMTQPVPPPTKGLVINYGRGGGGGGLQNGKIAGPKLFAPPLKTG